MSSNILSLNEITKKFGNLTVIDNLTFSVEENSVFGFIGKNGAGKTTTMKMILGLLKPDSGTMSICGETVTFGETKTNRFVGYLPDVPEFYYYMTPLEYLKLCGEITKIPSANLKKRCDELLNLVGLDGAVRRINGFSRGMRQRLGIAQALLNEPRLLICDEPTSALDPIGRKEILDIMKIARQKTTVLFSTHILSDVERICDHVGVLDEGRLVLQGNLNELKEHSSGDRIFLELEEGCTDLDILNEKLKALPYVSQLKREEHSFTLNLSDFSKNNVDLLTFLIQNHAVLLKYEKLESTLENLFMEVVR